ncbi:nicotinamide riboside transporter PnuC [Mucilaginibacter daejeonensis]|uniref:nicotinamide riboside transporter PnuC n=1 Tax=Mucilaginibacter daejeonensis TaxID=398049 RepID=UPI001D17ADC9|nr:nicotinamide riboside transporter PnuC [Mucilaginibacter daejeonensis]UEG53069.1 nicotinamide riboside transporter PnuC [Mucilaginibacter daejeonensis]
MHFLEAMLSWLQHQSILELTGVVTGLTCVYLAAINNIWNWPFAMVSTGIYIFIFAEAALYADMGQNIYLFGINVYGWYYWSRQPADAPKVPIIRMRREHLLWLIGLCATLTPILGILLTWLAPLLHYQPAAFPYIDSFCTVVSLTAQVFMARKILENWLIWIFVDVIYVAIYLIKDLQPTAFMFAIYALLAAKGYFDWRKQYRLQPA